MIDLKGTSTSKLVNVFKRQSQIEVKVSLNEEHTLNKYINRVRTELFKGTFFNRIPHLWNSLPDELRTANSSVSSF